MTLKSALFGAIIGLSLLAEPAMAVEEPAFKTVTQDGAFSVRDYPARVVAEVTVEGDQKQAAYRGFRLLAAYIFGGNQRKQSIAMTAPVAQAPSPVSEKIAMTAPVAQTRVGEAWTVQFTMPQAYSLETLPSPNDPRVHLRTDPGKRVAVVRFSGYAEPSPVAAKTAALTDWMRQNQLTPAGPPTLAQYNPPWTLWFLRRNEVMIPVAP